MTALNKSYEVIVRVVRQKDLCGPDGPNGASLIKDFDALDYIHIQKNIGK